MAVNKIFLDTDGLTVGNGQLVTSGNSVSIANALLVGGNLYAPTLGVSGNSSITGVLTVAGRIIASNTQNSSNTTTGAIVTSGGMGVAGNTNIGGSLTINGNTNIGGALSIAGIVTDNVTITGATSSANAVINSAAFTIANSTVTFSYVAPTSTQKANTTFYLNANGSWAAIAAGGGSANFNTNNNTAIGFAANTTLQAAYTAPATAGIRYIIYSIQVTNISTANASISGSFNGTTYANIAFAQSVPVPISSSVEMLKKPKIMQPSDVLRLQASADATLHTTISYETQTSTVLFGTGVNITSAATYTDLYTATAVAVVESVLLTNYDTVYDAKARVVWTDGSNVIQGYYCYELIIPQGATVEVLEASKGLPNGYKVRVYGNVANRLQAIIAGKVST
jgi:hypothetical protein